MFSYALHMLVLLLVFSSIQNAFAASLVMRAGLEDGHQVPAMTFIDNASPVINDRGDVAIKVLSLGTSGQQAVWIKPADGEGKVVHTAPAAKYLSEVSLGEDGSLLFNQFDEVSVDNLMLFQDGKVEGLLDEDELDGISGLSFPSIHKNGYGYRVTTARGDRKIIWKEATGESRTLMRDGGRSGDISYLFRPAFNDLGEVVVKQRLGGRGSYDDSQPDQIVYRKGDGSEVLLAMDHDADNDSSIRSFNNHAGINNKGDVLIVSQLGDGRKVIQALGADLGRHVIVEGEGDVSEIEYFTPVINDRGQVAFRAKDARGRRSLFFWEQGNLLKLASEGDFLDTDRETGRILLKEGYPGFSGNIDINEEGVVVAHVLLQSKLGERYLGAAIYTFDREDGKNVTEKKGQGNQGL